MSARVDGASVLPTAAKPRQVLALLALHPQEIVQIPALIEELWGGTPPVSALTTLQTYILQLRRRLTAALPPGGPGAKEVLVTVPGAYLLAVPVEQTDVGGFERLLPAGRRALGSGDAATASRLLHQALDLWRGPVTADVPHGRRLEIEAMRLEESRLGALELRISADMRLGAHARLLGELTALTARYPLHENLHAQLMLALYRSGRTSEALDVYRALRATLVEELGLEPAAKLQRLHQAMLSADPALVFGDVPVDDAVLLAG
ncbi:BTAD domain-containing putative transcriptional regulator [Kitasatospora sp. NPDC087314]|uniref:AfsR/SARP family transcriptional regulator n=1 Tax=Kitasatospora sp. NPDC087314 TaxID=3364068 RepID=UPI0037FDED8B